MSDATEPGGPTAEHLTKRAEFERLYRDWLNARAALNDPDLPEDDESADARGYAHLAAERALLMTPAPISWCVWWKWEVLSALLHDEEAHGPRAINVLIPAAAAIKADILRFGLKDFD